MGIWSFWLFLSVGFLIIEIFTLSAVCLYIGGGALCAMISALLGGEWIVSILTFVVSTTLLYVITYKWRKDIIKALHKGGNHCATGMEALIGRTGVIVEASDGFRMKIDGDLWQVRPVSENSRLSSGEKARVVGYDSIVLTVEVIR